MAKGNKAEIEKTPKQDLERRKKKEGNVVVR